jgi:trimeric autotransporter adhesin
MDEFLPSMTRLDFISLDEMPQTFAEASHPKSYLNKNSAKYRKKITNQMKPLIQFNKTTPRLLIPLTVICLGLTPMAQAVGPDTDGAIPGSNNGEGIGVLLSLVNGVWNTGTGFEALNHDTVGDNNTATGVRALFSDTSGSNNTATGVYALYGNTIGWYNNAVGAYALTNNTEGNYNTANGYKALYFNTEGDFNVAAGFAALYRNSTGVGNTANGHQALYSNNTGSGNTANGYQALYSNTVGVSNTASGTLALAGNTHGNNNTALGLLAGSNITTADNVVCIGAGVSGENIDNRTYIRNIGTFVQNFSGGVTEWVTVNLSNGKLGHSASSRRYKEDIQPMGDASELIYKLKPVTYRYKKDIENPTPNLDYGLVAEDVAEIDPKLAIRDGKGQIESVRYMAIYNMLLNEFIKEHRKVEELETTVAQQQKDFQTTIAEQKRDFESKIAHQQKQIEAFTTGLQRVSAQLELSKPAQRTVFENR